MVEGIVPILDDRDFLTTHDRCIRGLGEVGRSTTAPMVTGAVPYPTQAPQRPNRAPELSVSLGRLRPRRTAGRRTGVSADELGQRRLPPGEMPGRRPVASKPLPPSFRAPFHCACAAGSLRRGFPALAPVSPTGRVWCSCTKPVTISRPVAGLLKQAPRGDAGKS
jgi:hypothetical protein